ncbi:argininosuccinate lyase [Streptomyces sp. WAC07149]|uniref:argininosuccinate lyase n=1 Tax=Streptomyces sp. WAC07149 TaxID=2487425 RepID=UPI000F78897C|nr:lyase family protein [Streptomyces sp. WAC07149]RST08713.1 argininosuccinate lyase [Streptomyces sp. WAC07149]
MTSLSGRVTASPAELLHQEVLAPQFRYEAEHLLPSYVAVEKVLALEYARMGLIDAHTATRIGRILDRARTQLPAADPVANMSDIAFALERMVETGLDATSTTHWHVDRSRNDLQACAQLMFAREQTRAIAGLLLDLGTTTHALAASHTDTVMPGHTHYQAAQVISPGFYLAAVCEHVIHTAHRLLATYDRLDASPLGSGAMAGQELPWDRERMARLLGFATVQPHALTGVASRRAVTEITAELSLFGVTVSRFTTDLLTWGSSEYGFIDLPDDLSGISSAMPQKKNFPVLERIRGKTAHLTAFHTDAVIGQRNTPFSNLVEVSKEAGAHLHACCTTAATVIRLLTAVLDGVRFRPDRMRKACEREFLGGFTLANLLNLREGVPWRKAQVMAGRYVVAAMDAGRAPRDTDPALLTDICAAHGIAPADPAALLADAFDLDHALRNKKSAGSVHPDAVAALLKSHHHELAELRRAWDLREHRCTAALARTDRELGLEARHPADREAG